MKLNHDVVIVGGGPAGIVAAIASARKGMDVLLLDQNGYLGGNMTASLVGPMMSFHAGSTQVIRGIAQEIIDKLIEVGASPGHVKDSIGYTYTVTPYDVEKAKIVFEELVMDAGASLLYHAVFTDVHVINNSINHIVVQTKSGPIKIYGKIFIDCSGDGDLFAKAGADFEIGNPNSNEIQALTMMFKLVGVDIPAIRKDFLANPEMHWWKDMEAAETAERLSVSGYNQKLKEAIDRGEISFYRPAVLFFETNTKNEVIVNMSNITYINPLDVFEMTKAEMIGRKHVQEIFTFLKNNINGFQNAELSTVANKVGVRESRKLKGVYQLTADDMTSDVEFHDEVIRYGYPIDIHFSDKDAKSDREHFTDGHSFGVPYRCFLPKELDNLLVGGRCMSATYEAIGSLRTIPACMAMGHVIGNAAAIAIKNNVDVKTIDVESLRNILLKEGAFFR